MKNYVDTVTGIGFIASASALPCSNSDYSSVQHHSKYYRPFVCDGAPNKCQAFLIGINPATSLPAGSFRAHYRNGMFHKSDWLDWCRRHRGGELGPTRERIERVRDAVFGTEPPYVQLLETNVWACEAPRPSGVPREWRDLSHLTELLSNIKPSVVVFHARAIRRARSSLNFQRFDRHLPLGVFPDRVAEEVEQGWQEITTSLGTVSVRVSQHLCLVSFGRAVSLGREIRDDVLAPSSS